MRRNRDLNFLAVAKVRYGNHQVGFLFPYRPVLHSKNLDGHD